MGREGDTYRGAGMEVLDLLRLCFGTWVYMDTWHGWFSSTYEYGFIE